MINGQRQAQDRSLSSRVTEGFSRQQMVVLPGPVIDKALLQPITGQLMPTDVGLFPSARNHYVERKIGLRQAILIFCVRGEGWAEVGGRRGVVHENECLIVPPGQPHAYGAADDQPWTIYWCHLAGTGVKSLLELILVNDQNPTLVRANAATLVPLFERVIAILRAGYGRPALVSVSLAVGHLFGELIAGQSRSTETPELNQRLEDVLNYMRRQIRSTIRLTELAAIAHLSPSHFAAVFKRKTGYAVLNYFTRLKIQRACELLDLTEQPIKLVADEVGFKDPLYFTRTFRRIMAVSPRKYRSIHKG